ncbi:MAG: FHA domain-containing protein [Chloroflexi bacterium]|nr:FHA domain-containing protein [Chloroflexota bacterium]
MQLELREHVRGPDQEYGVLTYTDQEGRLQRYPLTRSKIIIGRWSEADLRLEAPEVAERHAQIACTNQGCYLYDLGGKNPTQLRRSTRHADTNGAPTQEVMNERSGSLLHDNDEILIGRFILRYRRRISGGSVLPPEVEAARWRSGTPQRAMREANLHWNFLIQRRNLEERPFWGYPAGLRHPPGEYLRYLPPLFQEDDVVNTFLLAFEAILAPLERTIDWIDAYLHPTLAPRSLLPWLASWVDVELPADWPEARQRRVIAGVARCYALRGTRRGLEDLLRLFTDGASIEVDDQAADLPPRTFRITVPAHLKDEESFLRRLIEREKPAHCRYELHFRAD